MGETTLEMNRIKKAIRWKKQKHQHHREFFSRLNELNERKTEFEN